MNVRKGATPSWDAADWVFWPCRYGWTPSLFTSLITGPMMNRLRNSASPASPGFGGTVVSPSALRTMLSTTKILVKLVQRSNSAGATDSTVIASRMTIELLGFPSAPLICTPTVALPLPVLLPAGPTGGVGAAGTAGAAGAVTTWSGAAAGTAAAGVVAEAGAAPVARAPHSSTVPSAVATASRRTPPRSGRRAGRRIRGPGTGPAPGPARTARPAPQPARTASRPRACRTP